VDWRCLPAQAGIISFNPLPRSTAARRRTRRRTGRRRTKADRKPKCSGPRTYALADRDVQMLGEAPLEFLLRARLAHARRRYGEQPQPICSRRRRQDRLALRARVFPPVSVTVSKQIERDDAIAAKQQAKIDQRRRVQAMLKEHLGKNVWATLLERARDAATHGEKAWSFPCDLCTDGSRKIDVAETDWADDVEGRGGRDLHAMGCCVDRQLSSRSEEGRDPPPTGPIRAARRYIPRLLGWRDTMHLPIAPARDRRSSLGTDTAFDCSRSPFRRRRFLHGAAFPPVRRRSRRYPCDRHHRSPVKEMTPTCHGSFDGKRGRPFPDHGDGPEARGVRRSRRGTIRRRFDPGNWGQTRPGSPILKAAIFRADRGRLQLVPANSAMQLPQSQ